MRRSLSIILLAITMLIITSCGKTNTDKDSELDQKTEVSEITKEEATKIAEDHLNNTYDNEIFTYSFALEHEDEISVIFNSNKYEDVITVYVYKDGSKIKDSHYKIDLMNVAKQYITDMNANEFTLVSNALVEFNSLDEELASENSSFHDYMESGKFDLDVCILYTDDLTDETIQEMLEKYRESKFYGNYTFLQFDTFDQINSFINTESYMAKSSDELLNRTDYTIDKENVIIKVEVE